jgi:hypothetical protein
MRISVDLDRAISHVASKDEMTPQAKVIEILAKVLGVKCNPPKVGRPKKETKS